MQGNRGGRHPFFESYFPFPEFGRPLPGFRGYGGFGGNRSLNSSFFGGRDPFDDPFFANPFGGMMESSFFGSGRSPFMGMHPPPAMIENRVRAPERRGPVIEDLNYNEEEEEESGDDRKENPRKHGRSNGKPDVEDANNEERRGKYLHHRDDFISNPSEIRLEPQGQSFTFHSSTVSYGGANGTYYTSSRTRRSGSDGVVFEECKEADSSTMQATHRMSRGLHNQGHSVTRKLGSDGKVNNIQTLHNLDEDQLPQFEQNWNGSARKHLPGWSEHLNRNGSFGNNWSGTLRHDGGYALPSTQQANARQRAQQANARQRVQLLQGQHSGSTLASDQVKDNGARRRQVQP